MSRLKTIGGWKLLHRNDFPSHGVRSTHTQSWAGSNLTVTVCKTGRKSQFITFICDPRNDICNGERTEEREREQERKDEGGKTRKRRKMEKKWEQRRIRGKRRREKRENACRVKRKRRSDWWATIRRRDRMNRAWKKQSGRMQGWRRGGRGEEEDEGGGVNWKASWRSL